MDNDKIEVLYRTEWKELLWDWKLLQQIKIFNNETNEESILDVNWLFYAIGHTPNTKFLDWQIKTDETGYIITKPWTPFVYKSWTDELIPWVYAGWDVQDHVYRQAITSAGGGCMAAMQAEHYLQSK